MKVFFDSAPLASGHSVRGIGAYTKSLQEELKKEKGVHLVNSKEAADVIHYPYFDLFFNTLSLVSGKPTVVTVFDVIPLLYPDRYPPGIRGRIAFLGQKKKLQKVSAVITISETSKKDIVRFLNVPAERIYPIHLAPRGMFRPVKDKKALSAVRKKYNLPASFVLYVGDVNYNKNLLRLAEAVKKIGAKLVIAGKQAVQEDFDRTHPENQPLVAFLDKYGKDKDILRLGFVSDEDLVALYNLATAYCQPSLYEGFGLPVLEAMASSCPVIAARTQSLVEISEAWPLGLGGKACIFVDPKDTDDIASGLKKVINDDKLAKELRKQGPLHAKKFSWQKTAEQTIKVYETVLKG